MEIRLPQLAARLSDLFQALARENEIEMIFIRYRLFPLYRDVQPLERSLEIFFGNALKHTPEGGKVEVAVVPSEEEKAVEIVVKGNGTGI